VDHHVTTRAVIGCALRVSNGLGVGFLEKVYENALAYEFAAAGLLARRQFPMTVHYSGIVVGEFVADFVVEDSIIVELKAAKMIEPAHEAQLLNYLKVTGLQVGLLLNFGTARLGIKRMVF
jgi:GxxExxY protein